MGPLLRHIAAVVIPEIFANAIRKAPLVYVTDEPGAPIRLCWTDAEGRFFAREIEPQHAINLIEDLSRALRARVGGAP